MNNLEVVATVLRNKNIAYSLIKNKNQCNTDIEFTSYKFQMIL
jgi:hypothetical protein